MKTLQHFIRLLLLVPAFYCSSALHGQNVGINTANPTLGKLEVYGAVGTTSAIFGGDGGGISLQRNYPSIGFNQYYSSQSMSIAAGTGFVQYLDMSSGSFCIDGFAPTSQPYSQLGGQTRRLTIRQNGNVSVCAGDANASLFIGNLHLGTTPCRIRGTQYHSVFAERMVGQATQHTYINAGKAGGNVFINDQGIGNVLIGGGTTLIGFNRSDPASVIDIKQVAGRGLVIVAPNLSYNNWGFTVNHEPNESQSDLWVYYNEGYKGNFFSIDGLYYKQSDRRMKTNIRALSPVLDKVMALRAVQYEMRPDNPGSIQSIGFIAQEVMPFFPELIQVVHDDCGYKDISDLHTMDYDAIGVIAIKAIQEQQQKIAALRTRNTALRIRIEAAEKALATHVVQ